MKNLLHYCLYIYISIIGSKDHFGQELLTNSTGTTYYVSSEGNLNGDGSYENPFLTINQGMDATESGDTILVLPGLYVEEINILSGVSLKSSETESAIIQAVGSIAMNDNTSITGFTILTYGNAIYCDGGSIKIKNNDIYNEQFSGDAIHCVNSSAEIMGNLLSNFQRGIFGAAGINSSVRGNFSIKNNILLCEYGIRFLEDCDADIYNNTIVFPNGQGIGIQARYSNNIDVQNNIITGAIHSAGFGIKNDGSYTTSLYAAYNNLWNIENVYEGDITLGAGNLNSNPDFVDLDSNNYHLAEGSPCIDGGNPNLQFNDLDSSRNDMGAYGGPNKFERNQTIRYVKKLSISNASGFPSDTISIHLSLDNSKGLFSATLSLIYNPDLLQPIAVNLTELTDNFTVQTEFYSHGEIELTLEGPEEISDEIANAKILEFLFQVANEASSGDASPFAIEDIQLFSAYESEIFLSQITNGVFIVNLGSEDGDYIFVDVNHNGFEDGSRNNPYNTISEGVSNAISGDTVVVASGEYNESIQMRENIHLRGASVRVTKIILSDDNSSLNFDGISNSEVSGFTFSQVGNDPFAKLIVCDNSSPLIRKNNFISNHPFLDNFGIICGNGSNAIIKNNSFNDIGMLVTGSNPTIEENYFNFDNVGTAIHCDNSAAPTISKNNFYVGSDFGISVFDSNPLIVNNWIFIKKQSGQGIYARNSFNVTVKNNIFSGSGSEGRGLLFWNSANYSFTNNTVASLISGLREIESTGIIYNNIISDNSEAGLQASSSTLIDYNDLWNNFEDYLGCTPGRNDISADPLFNDVQQSNFILNTGSPCINSGNPDAQYNDIDGSRNDMGAYGGPDADLGWLDLINSSLEMDSVGVSQTDTIQILISGSFIKEIAEIDITFTYDSEILTFLTANSMSITGSFSVTKTSIDINTIRLYLDSPIGISVDEGDMIELIFAVDASNNTISQLQFDHAEIKDIFSNERVISELSDGVININVTGIDDRQNSPIEYSLTQNYPNPFNPETVIEFSLPEQVKIELKVFDILGREIKTLVDKEMMPGRYKEKLSLNGLASGIYFYRLKAGEFIEAKKMLLLK
jgi:hypothetical protein